MPALNFDANKYEPTGSFEPVPIGDYPVIISSSEMKETKPKPGKVPGQYLQLTYDVIEGDYKGRKFFDRLNLINENQTAQEIAQRALSAICRAVGVMHPKDSSELHNKPLMVTVGIRAASGEYGASNEIRGYKTIDGEKITKDTNADGIVPGAVASTAAADAPAGAAAPAATTATTTMTKPKKPWEKKK